MLQHTATIEHSERRHERRLGGISTWMLHSASENFFAVSTDLKFTKAKPRLHGPDDDMNFSKRVQQERISLMHDQHLCSLRMHKSMQSNQQKLWKMITNAIAAVQPSLCASGFSGRNTKLKSEPYLLTGDQKGDPGEPNLLARPVCNPKVLIRLKVCTCDYMLCRDRLQNVLCSTITERIPYTKEFRMT